MRTVEAERITNETEIRLKLSVDGQGAGETWKWTIIIR